MQENRTTLAAPPVENVNSPSWWKFAHHPDYAEQYGIKANPHDQQPEAKAT